jgi:UDP-N-acetylmuramyl pentapeptide phosphotransferase/UDP-N-acetylglucosamine-1-phosphate transferase
MFASSLLAITLSAAVSYIGIEAIRRQSLARHWMDLPNDRSSHAAPTPIGGGLVIVVISLVAFITISLYLGTEILWGFATAGLLVAVISWLDDLYSVPFVWRLIVHFAAAVLLVNSNGYFQSAGLSDSLTVTFGRLGPAVTVLWVVWMINAYNFMDGIDGIAGVQAVTAGVAWALVWSIYSQPPFFLYNLVIVGACIGFLIHNWNPAKIFMGDVGSAFLGFTFASMPLLFKPVDQKASIFLPVAAVLFLWPFVFDSLLTLFRRTIRLEPLWKAHRQHLYQKLVIVGFSHASVAMGYGIIALAASACGLLILSGIGNRPLILILLLTVASIGLSVFVLNCTRPADSEGELNEDV